MAKELTTAGEHRYASWYAPGVYKKWMQYLGLRTYPPYRDLPVRPIGFNYEFNTTSVAAVSYYKDMMPDEWDKFRALMRMGVL